MKITQRQLGKIEISCTGLLALINSPVGKILVNTIREVVDEIDSDSDLDGDLNDLDFFSADSLEWPSIESIRQFAQEIRWEETGMLPAIRLILDHFSLNQTEFARLIGVSRRDLEHSLDWQDGRKELLARMTELFGTDGGAIVSGAGKTPAAAKVPQGHTDAPLAPQAAPEPPPTAPKKRGRRIKRTCPVTPTIPTPMSDADITRGRAKVLRLIQQRTPPDVKTLIHACIDEGISVSDLAALTGLSYQTLSKTKTTGLLSRQTTERFQDIFAFPRKSRSNISEEV